MKSFVNYFILTLSLLMISAASSAQSVGGVTSGAATYCTTTNSGFVSLAGQNGSILFWQLSTNGGISWINIGNTNPNQTYFNLNQTTCYRAVVKDGSYPTDTSTFVCINVYPPAVGGTLSGGGTFCGASASGLLTLSGNNGNVLNWEFSINNGATWNPISNTTTTENIGSVTQTTLYRVIVQSGSCPTDTSNIDTVKVFPQTVAGTISGPGSVCSGTNSGNLTLTGHVGSILNWRSSINSGSTWIPISNTTTSQSYLNLTQETWYQAIIKSGDCAVETTLTEIITIDAPVVAGSLSGGGTFCGSNASGLLTLNGYSGNIIGWESSTDGGATWAPITNTTNTENYTGITQTTLYQVLIQNGACSVTNSNIDTVFVEPQTVAGTVLSDTTVCPTFNQFDLILAGNIGNILYWLVSTDGGITWSNISNTTNILSINGLNQNTQYQAVVQSGNCNIDSSNTVTVTVFSLAPIFAGNDTLISLGESVLLNGSGSGTPLWSPALNLDNPNILNPLATPITTTNYILTIIDSNGCLNTDTVNITVDGTSNLDTELIITNLFTPNGDGINDFWNIKNIENNPNNEVLVFNTHGNTVFSQKEYTNNWEGTYNGKPLPDGTYYYIIKIESSDEVIKGMLDILR